MKHTNISILLLYVIFLAACNRTNEIEPQINSLPNEVSKAKLWYENSFDKSLKTKPRTTVVGHTDQAKQPVWELATVSERNGKTYIDVPLQYYRMDNGMQSTSSDVTNATDGAKVHRSALIVLEEDYSLVVLNIIPEEDFDMPTEGYGYHSLLEQDFKGKMIYSDFSGNLRGGHVFENGVATSKIKLFKRIPNVNLDNVRSEVNDGGNIDQGGCVIQVMPLYERYCDYDATGWEECTEWEPIGTYMWYECQIEQLEENPDGGGFTPPEETFFEIIKDPSFVNTKADCVYEKLNNLNSDFKTMINRFDGEFPVSHLKFSLDSSLPANVNGKTMPPENYLVEIKINSNGLNQRPVLTLARTIIHEVIHAEMFRKLLSIADNGGNLGGLTHLDLTNMLIIGDYPGIFDYYSRFAGQFQHEQMAGHYIDTISDILKEFDNGLGTDSFYDSLAWVGLMGTGTFNSSTGLAQNSTQAWTDLTANERLTIISIVNAYEQMGDVQCN